MIIKQKETNEIYFSDLEHGDVFSYGDNFYIKTEDTFSDVDGYYENAVKLSNGELRHFDDKIKVCLVDCELVIK